MKSNVCEAVPEARVDPKSMVDEVMRRWPATIGVFIRWRMKCVGCPFGTFHTIEHACLEHGSDTRSFHAALEMAVAEAEG
jgi:hybrid cluster-associated redox disulfide protein